MVFKQRFIAAVFVEFLTRLVRQAKGQKIILILDGHPVHRSARVRRWVEAHADQIELQFLPGYSPELEDDPFAVEFGGGLLSDHTVRR
jgi:transposase